MFTAAVVAVGLSGPRLRSAETLTTPCRGVSQQQSGKANKPCPAEETRGGLGRGGEGRSSCSETQRSTRTEKQRSHEVLFEFFDGRVQIVSQPFMYFNLFLTVYAAACGWSRGGALLSALSDFHILDISNFRRWEKSDRRWPPCKTLPGKLLTRSSTKLLCVYTLWRNTHEPTLHPSPRLSRHQIRSCFLFFSFFFFFKKYLYPASDLLSSAALHPWTQQRCRQKCCDTSECIIYFLKKQNNNPKLFGQNGIRFCVFFWGRGRELNGGGGGCAGTRGVAEMNFLEGWKWRGPGRKGWREEGLSWSIFSQRFIDLGLRAEDNKISHLMKNKQLSKVGPSKCSRCSATA